MPGAFSDYFTKSFFMRKKTTAHQALVAWWNEQHQGNYAIKEVPPQSGTSLHKHFESNTINNIVVLLTDALNLSAGSAGSIQLYTLLQAYILDPEKREQLNKIADKHYR